MSPCQDCKVQPKCGKILKSFYEGFFLWCVFFVGPFVGVFCFMGGRDLRESL